MTSDVRRADGLATRHVRVGGTRVRATFRQGKPNQKILDRLAQ